MQSRVYMQRSRFSPDTIRGGIRWPVPEKESQRWGASSGARAAKNGIADGEMKSSRELGRGPGAWQLGQIRIPQSKFPGPGVPARGRPRPAGTGRVAAGWRLDR